MRLTAFALPALTFITQPAASARATRQAKGLALTLVSRVTAARPDGGREVIEVVRHVSSDGGVRRIRRSEDGSVSSDYLFEKGRGGFFIRHEEKRPVNSWLTPPEAIGAPPTEAEPLISLTILCARLHVLEGNHEELVALRKRELSAFSVRLILVRPAPALCSYAYIQLGGGGGTIR